MAHSALRTLWHDEFAGYGRADLRRDALAGVTVAAVALPLALAFGVASGATAAAGVVTAILAGVVIGGLSGAPYQISGPTGAMSAILLVLANRYGLEGVWAAGAMAGLALIIVGALRLGRLVAFIPSPVVSGFTSGIAVIIAVGQIDNVLGVTTPKADTAAQKLLGYIAHVPAPSGRAVGIGLGVIALMALWPRSWQRRAPASLVAILAATAFAFIAGWDVPTIGAIPRSILLADRLRPSAIPWADLPALVVPALSIAALGAIESLLCGAVGSTMTGQRLRANQELIAQGIGNVLIPFFGGVPATAAIARTSVGIASGGRTRVVSLVHSAALLGTVLLAAPLMGRVPLAALAGVLLVTAWRMNEWETIRFMARHRLRSAGLKFGVTLLATVALDLTQAILLGVALSALLFLNQIAALAIDVRPVEPERLRGAGRPDGPEAEVDADRYAGVRVAYLTGPLFFAATGLFNETFADLSGVRVLILSMRGVPVIDTSGLLALDRLHARLAATGARLRLAAVQPAVRTTLERGGVLAALGADAVFWSAAEAILASAGDGEG